MVSKTIPHGSESRTKYGAKAKSDAFVKDYSYGKKILTHLWGDDDATIPFVDWNYLNPTHDIDVWTNLVVSNEKYENGNNVLTIKGSVLGDGFPSTEAFVKDAKGTAIFMGVGEAKAGAIVGPTWTLAGDAKEKQFDINMRISVDENGIFQGVYSTDAEGNETIISPEAWNKQFGNKDATGGN